MPKVKPEEFFDAFSRYLGCPCTALTPKDEDELTQVYLKALEEGKQQGFTPVIIIPDETLWESCKFNTAPDDIQSAFLDISLEDVAAYRKHILENELEDGNLLLKNALEERKTEYLEEYQCQLPVGQMQDGIDINGLNSLLTGQSKLGLCILAKIPVTNPWEIFAFIPFGNWNDCPDTPDLMSVSKYWYEKYQAYPALISDSILNFYVEQKVTQEHAMDLATEHFAICADIVDQGTETIGALADSLWQSKFWFFWWD